MVFRDAISGVPIFDALFVLDLRPRNNVVASFFPNQALLFVAFGTSITRTRSVTCVCNVDLGIKLSLDTTVSFIVIKVRGLVRVVG